MSSDCAPQRPSQPWLAAAAGIGVVVAVAVAGALWLAASTAAPPPATPQQALDAGPHPVSPQGIAEITDQLAQRLKTHPDDVEGWAMLARSYAVTGRHADALEPFAKALALRPDDPTLLADYADALAMTRQRSLEGEPSRLVERALAIDASHLKALSLAGTAAFDRRDYARAIELWERLRDVAPRESPFAESVQASIDEARQLVVAQTSSGIRSFAPRTAGPASSAVGMGEATGAR